MGCAHSPKSRPHAWAQSKVLWAQWSVVLYLPLSSGNKARHFLCPTWNTQGNLQRVCCYKLTSWLTWFWKICFFCYVSCFCHTLTGGHIWPHLFNLVRLLLYILANLLFQDFVFICLEQISQWEVMARLNSVLFLWVSQMMFYTFLMFNNSEKDPKQHQIELTKIFFLWFNLFLWAADIHCCLTPTNNEPHCCIVTFIRTNIGSPVILKQPHLLPNCTLTLSTCENIACLPAYSGKKGVIIIPFQ